ncbi:MAG TPA: cyclase family protein [Trebonia sp.]|jgi:kynurenine formamidase|nr:cyclase family protein [Trebonia sp.]
MTEYTRADFERLIRERRNWGRWGADDEVGAVNLITPDKRAAAAALVRSGRSVSMSMPFPATPGPDNPKPAAHFMRVADRPEGAGAATDYYGVEYHGLICTHIDALAHTWDANGMWQGWDPAEVISTKGASRGGIQAWSEGIITRGVLLNVPASRGTAYVTAGRPVHADELRAIAAEQGVTLEPGDCLVVYSGRQRWNEENPPIGTQPVRPGLHASCLEYIRDVDCALIAWDMQDATPIEGGMPWSVHAAIHAFGVAIIDNCDLEDLAAACASEGRYEFMLVVAPLIVNGGTGSPANPLAVF